MKNMIVLLTFFMLGCHDDVMVFQDCEKSTATLDEKLECGKADYPTYCWHWVRNAKCTKKMYKYYYPDTKPSLCDKAPKESSAFEACVAKGWNPNQTD